MAAELNYIDQYPSKTYYFLAIVIVLSFYGILVFLFSFKAPVMNIDNSQPGYLADVTMLPIERDPKFTWQRNLIASLDLLDPTVLSLPNPRYGFSVVRNLEFERPIEDFKPDKIKLQYSPRPPLSKILFNNSTTTLVDIVRFKGINDLDGAMPTPILYQKYDPFAYWTKESGDIVESIPPIPSEEIERLDDGTTVDGPTFLSVSIERDFARIRIVDSSGNKQLDELAISYLRRHLMKQLWAAQTEIDSEISTNDENVLVVHWRYLDNIKEADIPGITRNNE